MENTRSAVGFRKLGATGARGLGFTPSRARQLAVEAAWHAAAGPSIARRAVVKRVHRGVLEIGVADPAWRLALERIVPEIEARLTRDHPALAIERVRLLDL